MKDNFRHRTRDVDMIIVHSMGEFIGGTFAYDFLDEIGLSAHFLIDSAGNLFNGVPLRYAALHAGKSKWEDQTDLNRNSIGIELLVPGDHTYSTFVEAIKDPENFSDDHYKKCAKLCRDCIEAFPKLTKDRILRHSDVSGPEVRDDPKVDPGEGFDMERLIEMI